MIRIHFRIYGIYKNLSPFARELSSVIACITRFIKVKSVICESGVKMTKKSLLRKRINPRNQSCKPRNRKKQRQRIWKSLITKGKIWLRDSIELYEASLMAIYRCELIWQACARASTCIWYWKLSKFMICIVLLLLTIL